MNKLDREARSKILHLLCEGSSIRAVTRLTGASKNTVTKLLVDAGRACSEYQDRVFRGLSCKRIQVDEIWTFTAAKQANVEKMMKPVKGAGDTWTWTAICADTKLVPSWYVGNRDSEAAETFIRDLASRLANKIQITSDGHRAYVEAVRGNLPDADYAQLVKIYGNPMGTRGGPERLYSPPVCTGAKKKEIFGNPDEKHISTSYAERQNLTMRMQMRRFTRLTNAFSKKVENHAHAVSLHFMHYNFVRIHKTLRITPAMAAGVTERLWDMGDIVGVIEKYEADLARLKQTYEYD